MANPHNIKVGQEVIILRIGNGKAYKSERFDEVNIEVKEVVKVGRLYFSVKIYENSDMTEEFLLETLEQKGDDDRWKRWRCFIDREGIEKLKQREMYNNIVAQFIDKYRYSYCLDMKDEELELWIEFIGKIEALKNGNG